MKKIPARVNCDNGNGFDHKDFTLEPIVIGHSITTQYGCSINRNNHMVVITDGKDISIHARTDEGREVGAAPGTP